MPGTVVEGPWNEVLSDAAGEPVRLVRASDPGAGHDEYPVTLRVGDALSVRPAASRNPAVTRPGRLDDPPAGVGMLPGDEQVSGHGAGIVAAIRSPR